MSFFLTGHTLGLIQLMLNDRNIPYTRIDGKTSLPKRTEALQNFQNEQTLRVILVSIICGGAGSANHHHTFFSFNHANRTSLDLTAASRVYLVEPHWNPMIEEQALCRVHRVGQKRDVTTIRYLMRDSFEEVKAPHHSAAAQLHIHTDICNSKSSRSKNGKNFWPK